MVKNSLKIENCQLIGNFIRNEGICKKKIEVNIDNVLLQYTSYKSWHILNQLGEQSKKLTFLAEMSIKGGGQNPCPLTKYKFCGGGKMPDFMKKKNNDI